jgi:hypothetical protein
MDEPRRRRVDAVAQSALVEGTSLKAWPRWLSRAATGPRSGSSPWPESSRSTTFVLAIGFVELGQPELLSYLSTDANSGSPDTTST